jgi:hypothetical protein
MHETSKTTTVSVGPGLPTLLTLLFVGLKLTGYVAWPWVWVLSPLWIVGAAYAVLFLVLVAIVAVDRG